MNPILETSSPFVIKVYETFFHVSWDGLTDKTEDRYSYDKVKSVSIKKGKTNLTQETLNLIATSFLPGITDTDNSDEFIIEFKTGEIEIRYLHGESSNKIIDAVNLITSKISIK